MDVHSSTCASAISAAANEMKVAAPAGGAGFEFVFEGMVFTVTEGNEVAEVLDRGAVRVLGSENFFDEDTGTQEHFVDVQGRGEAMLLLVSVREDQQPSMTPPRCVLEANGDKLPTSSNGGLATKSPPPYRLSWSSSTVYPT
ncbi:hypothetical protein EJB05_47928, partial [Eragrostis curvula]